MGPGAAALALSVALMKGAFPYGPAVGHFSQLNRVPTLGEPFTTFEVHIAGGVTPTPFIGTIDPRTNFLIGFTYCKPEPHFRSFHRRFADLMQELYFEHSHSPGVRTTPPNTYDAVGYLFGARRNWRWGKRLAPYADLGWGFQYNNHRSVDLPSRFNTTPFLDFGVWFPNHAHPFRIGLRYLHISNAKQVGTNHGQNQFFLDVGVRF